MVQKYVIAVPVKPPDKQTLTNKQPGRIHFILMLLPTATAISKQIKLLKQFNGKQRRCKVTPKFPKRCFIVRGDHRGQFREQRTGKFVASQQSSTPAHYPRDSLRPDSHHGHWSNMTCKNQDDYLSTEMCRNANFSTIAQQGKVYFGTVTFIQDFTYRQN